VTIGVLNQKADIGETTIGVKATLVIALLLNAAWIGLLGYQLVRLF
jgi:hypothetical protein